MSAMKIGSVQFDIAQALNLKHIFVVNVFGDGEAAQILRRQELRPWVLDYAKTGVHCAANIDAVVAVGAALIDEKLQALLLFFREGSVVAFEPTVEGCVGRDQR